MGFQPVVVVLQKHNTQNNTAPSKQNMFQLLVTDNVVPSSSILSTVMMETIRSYEKSVPTRATRRHMPEDDIPHNHRRENLKSYISINRLDSVAET
jgi:hypothetical protein